MRTRTLLFFLIFAQLLIGCNRKKSDKLVADLSNIIESSTEQSLENIDRKTAMYPGIYKDITGHAIAIKEEFENIIGFVNRNIQDSAINEYNRLKDDVQKISPKYDLFKYRNSIRDLDNLITKELTSYQDSGYLLLLMGMLQKEIMGYIADKDFDRFYNTNKIIPYFIKGKDTSYLIFSAIDTNNSPFIIDNSILSKETEPQTTFEFKRGRSTFKTYPIDNIVKIPNHINKNDSIEVIICLPDGSTKSLKKDIAVIKLR